MPSCSTNGRESVATMTEPSRATKTEKEGFLCGNPAAAPFADLDDFYARGQLAHLEEFYVFTPEQFITKVLIPIKMPDYARATLDDAVAALSLTPEPDFVARLLLVDHVHPWTPWLQQSKGRVIAGENSADGTVVLYRPTAGGIAESLLYEWCDLLRTLTTGADEVFSLTEALEEFPDPDTGQPIAERHVAWNLLGSLLLRAEEKTLFAACVRFPLKSAVFGRALVKVMLDVGDFRQQPKYQDFLDRARFIHFTASRIALRALNRLPDRSSSVEKLLAFLAEEDLTQPFDF